MWLKEWHWGSFFFPSTLVFLRHLPFHQCFISIRLLSSHNENKRKLIREAHEDGCKEVWDLLVWLSKSLNRLI
jgi:hypothetical protein